MKKMLLPFIASIVALIGFFLPWAEHGYSSGNVFAFDSDFYHKAKGAADFFDGLLSNINYLIVIALLWLIIFFAKNLSSDKIPENELVKNTILASVCTLILFLYRY